MRCVFFVPSKWNCSSVWQIPLSPLFSFTFVCEVILRMLREKRKTPLGLLFRDVTHMPSGQEYSKANEREPRNSYYLSCVCFAYTYSRYLCLLNARAAQWTKNDSLLNLIFTFHNMFTFIWIISLIYQIYRSVFNINQESDVILNRHKSKFRLFITVYWNYRWNVFLFISRKGT